MLCMTLPLGARKSVNPMSGFSGGGEGEDGAGGRVVEGNGGKMHGVSGKGAGAGGVGEFIGSGDDESARDGNGCRKGGR